MQAYQSIPLRTAHAINERERTSDVLTEENSNVDFASMFLSERVTVGLLKVGFEKPSPIQLKAIPLGRCGLDLIVQAKSGTGKTCVFSVIALEGIDLTNPSTQVLVLAPTREIAVQIQDNIQAIGCEMEGLRCHVFIGGTLFGPDRQKLKKCHIAVGTPGRIKQLIEYEVLKTGTIRLFVLDEADKLLDDTFQEQVNWIYNHLSDNKQMLALSATYPEYLAKHLTKYMREPMFVRLNPKDLALRGIKQLYVELAGHTLPNKAFEIKVVKLLKILTQVSFNQCLIFSNLQTRAQNLCDILCDCGWPSECISGAQEQSKRLSAMAKLKKFQCRILISTDLTARGIDAENVNLIINLDIPTDTKTYLHRIGRAGRFGTHGAAISLASKGREMELLRNIQRQCRVIMTELPDPAPSDLLKQDLNSTGFQQVSIASEALLPVNKKNSKENSTTDDGECSDTASISEEALFTSSNVKEEEVNQKSVIINGTESNIILLTSDEQGSLQTLINGNNHKIRHKADTLVDRKTPKIVESTGNKCIIPQTHRGVLEAPKVDACIQTMPEDEVQPKTMLPHIPNVSGSGDFKDRPTLPIGFEDAPELRKLCLPHWMQIKRGDMTRRDFTWYEGRESFEKFMREREEKDGSKGSKDDKAGNEASVTKQTVIDDKELLVETSRYNGDTDDAGLSSSSSEVTSSKDLKINYDSQVMCKGEVHEESENTAQDIVQKETSGLTPIREIERYRALLYDKFICNITDKGDTSAIDIKLENHKEAITAVIRKAKEKNSVEIVNPVLDIPAVSHKQVAKELGDRHSAQQTQCLSNISSKQHGAAENIAPQTHTIDRMAHETKDVQDIDVTVKGPVVERRLHHRASTDSQDMQYMHDLETESKPKARNTIVGKKKGKQQRIKQHVFQMSTLGAMMSPKELDLALISNPNINSCDGDLDTNDTDREKVEILPLCKKVNLTHQVYHGKDIHASEEGDTACSKNWVICNEEIQIPESSGKDSVKKKQVKTSAQKSNDSSVSLLDDPVWATFKNFIPACLPSEVNRKETKESVTGETSSEQSSSSLCESDTSTCSSTSSEDDSEGSDRDEEEEDHKEAYESESKDALEGNESAVKESRKYQTGPNQAKVGVSSYAENNGSLNEEISYYKGQNKDGQYPFNPSWTTEPPCNQSGCNVEGLEYDGSFGYYPTASPYHGWQYPCYSSQFYPNNYYWNDYYHGYTQQPYSGYPYFSSYVPHYT